MTILFAALATTNEAEEDPERTAALFDRLHTEAAAEIEAAGGTVEKGLVGALLATFGAATGRGGDHARRAAGAALATRRRLAHEFGATLVMRMGLESGDVLLGRPGTSVTGAPVTAASRLVRLAQPDEIVVGDRAAAAIGAAFDLRKHAGATILVAAGSAAPMVDAQPLPEVRKNVTVLFADLVESTRLGEQLDPEALRRLLRRYFDAMRSVIERHGGTVEKFIGDAVMAVFGVPVVHEDDALRAVRAAAEMRESLATLNEELERTWGIRLEGRIGINTGEVIAGDHLQGQPFVTGRPSNVAKRLEEAAATNEILMSEATHGLVRAAVVVEPVSDRLVKGGETVEALRLVAVFAHASPGARAGSIRRSSAASSELSSIRSVFASVVQNRACHLLTVLGPAGIGKSRLVQEFVDEVADGRDGAPRPLPALRRGHHVLAAGRGRAGTRSAAEGAAGEEPSVAALAELVPGELKAGLIGELISQALGLGGAGGADGRGDVLGRAQALRGASRSAGRSWSSSTTSSGRSRRSSISSATSRISRATRRSSCCAWRAPSSSTTTPAGAAASSTRRR